MALPGAVADDVELVVIGVELVGAERERDDDPVVAIAAGRGIVVPATGLLRLITSVRYCIHNSRTRWDLLQDVEGPKMCKERWRTKARQPDTFWGPRGSEMGSNARCATPLRVRATLGPFMTEPLM